LDSETFAVEMRLIVNPSVLGLLFAWSLVRVTMYLSFPGPRSSHADRTLVFILVYPFMAWMASQRALPPALAIPLALLGVAFMFAGRHLQTALKNPEEITRHTYVGLPYFIWIGIIVGGTIIGFAVTLLLEKR
jgi:uncharacterized membrane protein YedE/YeeE